MGFRRVRESVRGGIVGAAAGMNVEQVAFRRNAFGDNREIAELGAVSSALEDSLETDGLL